MADVNVQDILERSYVKEAEKSIVEDIQEKKIEMAKKILVEMQFIDKRKKELVEELEGIEDLDFEDIYKSYSVEGANKRY